MLLLFVQQLGMHRKQRFVAFASWCEWGLHLVVRILRADGDSMPQNELQFNPKTIGREECNWFSAMKNAMTYFQSASGIFVNLTVNLALILWSCSHSAFRSFHTLLPLITSLTFTDINNTISLVSHHFPSLNAFPQWTFLVMIPPPPQGLRPWLRQRWTSTCTQICSTGEKVIILFANSCWTLSLKIEHLWSIFS